LNDDLLLFIDQTSASFYIPRMNINVNRKPIPRVAVVGCGAWGKNLVRNFAELGALSAVCDVDPVKAESLAGQYNVPFLSEEEVFSNPEIDAIVVSSLAPLHVKHGEAALKNLKHVYIEKPMALTSNEAKHLCSLAKDNNRTLMIGHILNYHPAFIELKKRLPELGPLKHIYANRLGLGRFRRKESVLWDLASHDISLILSLTQNMPIDIHAVGQAFITPQKPASALLQLTFPGDITAHLHASWLSPFKEQKLVVIGEKGVAIFDDRKPWQEKLSISFNCLTWQDGEPHANDAFESKPIPLIESEPLRNECSHFLDCIQNQREPITSGHEGLRVTEVLEAADTSLMKGKP
jgi:UDP-2-acetamido-3-amino-2,3-dideoxy-glucuronate N-acetyltransferase